MMIQRFTKILWNQNTEIFESEIVVELILNVEDYGYELDFFITIFDSLKNV